MNLSKLVHEVWKDPRTRAMRLRKDEVRILVEVVIDRIVEGLLTYGRVKLQNLFTLDIRKAKGRNIAHPQTGQPMEIDDYYKVGVEPSKRLKNGLKELREKEKK